jgi:hypothetical protein
LSVAAIEILATLGGVSFLFPYLLITARPRVRLLVQLGRNRVVVMEAEYQSLTTGRFDKRRGTGQGR